jgi:hypothetical protein
MMDKKPNDVAILWKALEEEHMLGYIRDQSFFILKRRILREGCVIHVVMGL